MKSCGVLLFLNIIIAKVHDLKNGMLFLLVVEWWIKFPEACNKRLFNELLEIVRDLLSRNRYDLHCQVHCDHFAEFLNLRRPIKFIRILFKDAHAGHSDELLVEIIEHLFTVFMIVERGRPIFLVCLLLFLLEKVKLLRLNTVQLDLQRL